MSIARRQHGGVSDYIFLISKYSHLMDRFHPVPASSWQYPSSWTVPSFWILLDPTWRSWLTPLPAQDWECDGTGNDGWIVDWENNSCPYDVPESNGAWLWFGVNYGRSSLFPPALQLAD